MSTIKNKARDKPTAENKRDQKRKGLEDILKKLRPFDNREDGYQDANPEYVECFLSDIREENMAQDRVCPICRKIFSGSGSIDTLLDHLSINHEIKVIEKKLSCQTCHRVFYSEASLHFHKATNHSSIDDGATGTVVSNDSESNNKTQDQNNHSSVEKLNNKIKEEVKDQSEPMIEGVTVRCYLCQEMCGSRTYLSFHLEPRHGDKSCAKDWDGVCFKCKKCGHAFPNFALTREHFFKVHKAVYRCATCHVVFKSKKALKNHRGSHHKDNVENQWSCIICDKEVSSFKALSAHIKMKHDRDKRQRFPCRLCEEKFPTKEERKLHYAEKHSDTSPFRCVDCGKGFSSKSGLYGHRRVHQTDQQFICQHCGKIFTRRDSYQEHILIHVGPRHRCPHCQKEFVQRSNLARHVRIHTGQKPYPCTFCDKRFSDKGACNSHIRVHTKEEQCACPYCGQTFTKKQKMKYHIRKHTGEGLLSCEICAKTFTNTFSLKMHRSIHDRQIRMICVERSREEEASNMENDMKVTVTSLNEEDNRENNVESNISSIQTEGENTVVESGTITAVHSEPMSPFKRLVSRRKHSVKPRKYIPDISNIKIPKNDMRNALKERRVEDIASLLRQASTLKGKTIQ